MSIDFGKLITAMVTPFDLDGDIDTFSVERLVKHLCETSDSILINGTTGESPVLEKGELLDLIHRVKYDIEPCVNLIVGVGGNSTKYVLDLLKKVDDIGVDGILSVVPYYNKPSQEGLIYHFRSIADNTNSPVILYNIPSRTGVNMLPETVQTLAKVPNIVGIKQSYSDLNFVSEMRLLCPEDFVIYSGDDSLTLPMMALGAKGAISVASNLVGGRVKKMIEERSLKMHLELFPLFQELFKAPNPVPIKHALFRRGIIDCSRVRMPLTQLNPAQKKSLEDELKFHPKE